MSTQSRLDELVRDVEAECIKAHPSKQRLREAVKRATTEPPYACYCGRTNPGGCDVMHGACAWNPPR